MTTLFVTFDGELRHAHGYTFLSCTWISTIGGGYKILIRNENTFGALFWGKNRANCCPSEMEEVKV